MLIFFHQSILIIIKRNINKVINIYTLIYIAGNFLNTLSTLNEIAMPLLIQLIKLPDPFAQYSCNF